MKKCILSIFVLWFFVAPSISPIHAQQIEPSLEPRAVPRDSRAEYQKALEVRRICGVQPVNTASNYEPWKACVDRQYGRTPATATTTKNSNQPQNVQKSAISTSREKAINKTTLTQNSISGAKSAVKNGDKTLNDAKTETNSLMHINTKPKQSRFRHLMDSLVFPWKHIIKSILLL